MYMLLYILFGLALFGGGGVLLHNWSPPASDEQPAAEDKTASADPQGAQPGAPKTQVAPDDGKTQTSETGPAPAATAPSFDVVRIEKSGDGVIAGRAEPGWTVIVEAGEREVARARADKFGEWTVVFDEPLPPGEHSVGLRALSPGASRGLASEQHVSVSIAGDAGEDKTVVALSSPGEPTRILTPKEPAETAAPAAKSDTEAAPETAEQKPVVEPVPQAAKPEQAAPTPPAEPATPEVAVSFNAVDYEASEGSAGKLFLSGEASSGARVKLYLDNKRIGETVADADGRWMHRSDRALEPATSHKMRADAVQGDGQVTSRAEVAFTPPAEPEPQIRVAEKSKPRANEPEAPAEKSRTPLARSPVASEPPARPARPEVPVGETKPEVAAAPESTSRMQSAAPSEPKPSETVTAAREPEPAPAGEQKPEAAPSSAPSREKADDAPSEVASAPKAEEQKPDAGVSAVRGQKRSIVVRRGDTLWHIAERRYGAGIRYTAIYKDNRKQIRNPHWIYPGQEFSLPSN